MNTRVFKLSFLLLGLLILAIAISTKPEIASAEPNGFITFENGTDGAVISSTVNVIKLVKELIRAKPLAMLLQSTLLDCKIHHVQKYITALNK